MFTFKPKICRYGGARSYPLSYHCSMQLYLPTLIFYDQAWLYLTWGCNVNVDGAKVIVIFGNKTVIALAYQTNTHAEVSVTLQRDHFDLEEKWC